MKKKGILVFLIFSMTNFFCQDVDSIVVSSGSPNVIYPLIDDKGIENYQKGENDFNVIYPLLVLNSVIIREKEKVECFRNEFDFTKIKSTKLISKREAEERGIVDVPLDGVLLVVLKKGYYFDISCE